MALKHHVKIVNKNERFQAQRYLELRIVLSELL